MPQIALRISHKLALAVAIPLLVLASLAAYDLSLKWTTRSEMVQLDEIARGVGGISRLIHEFQRERGASAVFVGTKGAQLRAELPAQRKLTDAQRKSAGEFFAQLANGASDDLKQKIAAAQTAVAALDERRSAIDAFGIPATESNAYFTATIAKLLAVTDEIAKISKRGDVNTAIGAYVNFMQGKERAGQERASGAAGVSAGKFDLALYTRVLGLAAAQDTYFADFAAAATREQVAFLHKTVDGALTDTVVKMRGIIAKGGLTGDMAGLDGKAWFEATTARIDAFKIVEDRIAADLVQLTQAIKGEATQSLWTLGGTVAVVFVACLVLVTFLARGITRPLARLTAAMERLASGDLGFEVPGCGRRDEIGEIGRAVELFKVKAVEKARAEAEAQQAQAQAAAAERKTEMHKIANAFEKAVGGIVHTVSSSATELEASASTLTQAATTTQELSTVVAGASNEASVNVQSVAGAAEELAVSVAEISRRVEESSNIARQAVDQASKTDTRITELSEAATRIGDVVKLITAIAEQTNLLALNAAIEAARAGEAGRGFAVVAQEVKALAAQTAKATDEISSQINNMQSATGDSVAAIKEIGATIGKISENAAAIAAAVQQQGATTQEIARNVQQAAAGTSEVAENIGQVNKGANETGTASSQVLASAQALSTEGSKLKLEVDRFLETVRAA